jgi:DNA-binding transcriptional MerR regulator
VFRIGDFSRIARVSCRLLRYYDEIGLLKPAQIGRDTRYRYYSASQLSRLNRILVLKDLGLSLEQIGRVLKDDLPASELRGMLLMRRSEVEQSIEEQTLRLKQIESRLVQIEAEGKLTADDVIIRQEPAHRLLSMRLAVPSFAEAIRLIGELIESVPHEVGNATLGEFVGISHSADFEPENMDVELGFYLQAPTRDRVRLHDGRVLTVREVPAVEHLAACVRVGPPQTAHLTTGRIAQYIESNGYRLSGPNREVFLQRPRVDRMQDSVVEMQFPVERA